MQYEQAIWAIYLAFFMARRTFCSLNWFSNEIREIWYFEWIKKLLRIRIREISCLNRMQFLFKFCWIRNIWLAFIWGRFLIFNFLLGNNLKLIFHKILISAARFSLFFLNWSDPIHDFKSILIINFRLFLVHTNI